MDNQHQNIVGYRDLSQAEISAMNRVKEKGEEIGKLIEDLNEIEGIDLYWIECAEKDLKVGFMELVRAIAQPTTF